VLARDCAVPSSDREVRTVDGVRHRGRADYAFEHLASSGGGT
jgi:hypothetical protein